MEITILECDHCHAQYLRDDGRIITFSVRVDRRMDAAGSMDDVCETIDLCPNCQRAVISQFLNAMTDEQRVAFHCQRAVISQFLNAMTDEQRVEFLKWLRKK